MSRPLDPSWPRIDRSEIEWVWCDDWYDGPLSGLGLYRGEKVWLEVWEWDRGPMPMLVYALTPAQLAAELHWHARFEAEVRTGATSERFYADLAARADTLDLDALPVLGWYLTE